MNQFDFRRQHLIQAIADDAVSLPAADFHDGPGARDQPTNLIGQLPGPDTVAIFSQMLHLVRGFVCCFGQFAKLFFQNANFIKQPQSLLG